MANLCDNDLCGICISMTIVMHSLILVIIRHNIPLCGTFVGIHLVAILMRYEHVSLWVTNSFLSSISSFDQLYFVPAHLTIFSYFTFGIAPWTSCENSVLTHMWAYKCICVCPIFLLFGYDWCNLKCQIIHCHSGSIVEPFACLHWLLFVEGHTDQAPL